MKIKLLSKYICGDNSFPIGEVIDLPNERAEELIRANSAEAFAAPESESEPEESGEKGKKGKKGK